MQWLVFNTKLNDDLKNKNDLKSLSWNIKLNIVIKLFLSTSLLIFGWLPLPNKEKDNQFSTIVGD